MVAASAVKPDDRDSSVLIRRIALENLLSFGPDKTEVELGPLNVLIGPNGSGKSNFIAALGLLQAAPRDLAALVRETGGIGQWLHRSKSRAGTGSISAVVDYPPGGGALCYDLRIEEQEQRLQIGDECVKDHLPAGSQAEPRRYFHYENRTPFVRLRGGAKHRLTRAKFDSSQSILSQRKDPDGYPEITFLADRFEQIRIYREWSFGRGSPTRHPQPADLPNDLLADNTANLGLILNRLRRVPANKKRLLEAARQLYEGVTDFDVIVEGGTVQVFLEENGITVSASRLSDGTLRYLCLLAILCHDDPPPLVCIEEPELGLHPDMMPTLAELLRGASERCQLIVTTHSDVLVDALTEEPESVVVCEKHQGCTQLRRLNRDDLGQWLTRYGLGELWMKGELGGSRW